MPESDCASCRWRYIRRTGNTLPALFCGHPRVRELLRCEIPYATTPLGLVAGVGPRVCARENLYEPGPEMEHPYSGRKKGKCPTVVES